MKTIFYDKKMLTFNKFIFAFFLESAKPHFDIVASKIGAKLNFSSKYGNFTVINYGHILVNFLRILSTESTISQKNKNRKNCNIVFS